MPNSTTTTIAPRARLRAAAVAATGALAAACLIALRPAAPLRADPAPTAPPTAALSPKDLFAQQCSACHNLPDPTADVKTAAQWQRTVQRMVTRYGADISAGDQQTITTYLATFAAPPAPAAGGAPDGIGQRRAGVGGGGGAGEQALDVWDRSPAASRVFRFRTPSALDAFQVASGAWALRDGASGPELVSYCAPGAPAGAVLLSTGAPMTGDAQIEAEFASAPAASAAAAPPLAFGIVFGARDAGSYDAVRYDDRARTLQLVAVAGGRATVLQSVPLAAGLAAQPGGWHKLKLMLTQGHALVFLDYDKEMDAALPGGASPAGRVGLWSGGRAAVRDVAVDDYAQPGPPPLADDAA